MHGLVGPQEFEEKVGSLQEEFGVKVGHSGADVRRPEEIRFVNTCYHSCQFCHHILWEGGEGGDFMHSSVGSQCDPM